MGAPARPTIPPFGHREARNHVAARQAGTRRWLVLAVMCLGLLLIVMDNTIVNVALPARAQDREDSDRGAGARSSSAQASPGRGEAVGPEEGEIVA
jgi:hypothetical protein